MAAKKITVRPDEEPSEKTIADLLRELHEARDTARLSLVTAGRKANGLKREVRRRESENFKVVLPSKGPPPVEEKKD